MAQQWDGYVPSSFAVPIPIPLAWHLLLQQQIPVDKKIVTTAAGGVSVALPSNFIDALSGDATKYGVTLQKQEVSDTAGEPYISDKTATGFKIRLTDETTPVSVLYVVWWLPA